MEMDWVKRKAIGEQFIEKRQPELWRSLCDSLESAIESYNRYYGGSAQGHRAGEHAYQIVVNSKPPYQDAVIEVVFDSPEVRVASTMGHRKRSVFLLNPNKEMPFRNHDKEQLTVDEVSEAILHCSFFPTEQRGVPAHTVRPCPEMESRL